MNYKRLITTNFVFAKSLKLYDEEDGSK